MKHISKQISYLLRHNSKPLEMDKNGWVDVFDLIKHIGISRESLDVIVQTNNKKRFSFNEDKTKIRANQGHSLDVDVELKEMKPPEFLYHGTALKNKNSILNSGIKKMDRIHVHLSADVSYND